jgi:hypothetical protein
MEIPYQDMVNYYIGIINNIYKEIKAVTPIEWGDGLCDVKYPEEYKNAYGWLQRAEWRLSDTKVMCNYYDEEEFKYYGIHNLSNVRHRIDGYLNETEFEFSEKVTDYRKYDEYVELNKELIHDDEFHKWFDYYSKLEKLEQDMFYLDSQIKWVKSDIGEFKRNLNPENMSSVFNEYLLNREELLNIVNEMEDLLDKFRPEYKELKS